MRTFTALIVLIILAGAGGYWWWTTTPQFALGEIRAAIRSHDLEKFEKYVDLDSVASEAVDDVLTDSVQRALGAGALGNFIGASLVGLVKPNLVQALKQQIIHYVETGNTGPASDQTSSRGQLSFPARPAVASEASWPACSRSSIAPNMVLVADWSVDGLPRQLGLSKNRFKGIDYTRMDGKVALIGISLHNERYNRDLLLELKFHDMGGYWRLIELSNLPDFIGKIMEMRMEQRQNDNQACVPFDRQKVWLASHT